MINNIGTIMWLSTTSEVRDFFDEYAVATGEATIIDVQDFHDSLTIEPDELPREVKSILSEARVKKVDYIQLF